MLCLVFGYSSMVSAGIDAMFDAKVVDRDTPMCIMHVVLDTSYNRQENTSIPVPFLHFLNNTLAYIVGNVQFYIKTFFTRTYYFYLLLQCE